MDPQINFQQQEDPRFRKLISTSTSNGWRIKTHLTKFKKVRNQKQTLFDRVRIKINLPQDAEASQRHSIREAFQTHATNVNSRIQTYYNVMQCRNNPRRIVIEAQIYRFTFQDMFKVCQKEKLVLPLGSAKFVAQSLIDIYRFLLQLAQTHEGNKSFLFYCPSLENLAFKSSYEIILINPCVAGCRLQGTLIKQNHKVHCFFLQKVVAWVQQFKLLLHPSDASDLGFFNFLQGYDDKEECAFNKEGNLSEEKKLMKDYRMAFLKGSTAPPQELFAFLIQEIEPRLRKIEPRPATVAYFEQAQDRVKEIIRDNAS